MKLIVGLGNPGTLYDNTRHNVGFKVIDAFAKKNNVSFNKEKFGGKYTKILINGEKTILLKPQRYINLSGEVIKKYVDYFKIDIDDILIISDDMDIEIGRIKLKLKGSSGGHNGLKNIELHLGTKEYKRLKIGISKNKNIDSKDYVLGTINTEESKVLENVIKISTNILEDYNKMTFSNLMNKYN